MQVVATILPQVKMAELLKARRIVIQGFHKNNKNMQQLKFASGQKHNCNHCDKTSVTKMATNIYIVHEENITQTDTKSLFHFDCNFVMNKQLCLL